MYEPLILHHFNAMCLDEMCTSVIEASPEENFDKSEVSMYVPFLIYIKEKKHYYYNMLLSYILRTELLLMISI